GWDVTHGTGQSQEVSLSETVTGDADLDANGTATLKCPSPFRSGVNRRATVEWLVDVLSKDGQSMRSGADARIQFVPKILGASLEALPERKLSLHVGSFDVADQPADGLAGKAEIFYLTVKTVKEPVGGGVNRYVNSPEFKPVWEGK